MKYGEVPTWRVMPTTADLKSLVPQAPGLAKHLSSSPKLDRIFK